MATKSLSVLGFNGAGKKSLLGRLLYECGIQLSQLGKLEQEGISEYAKIPSFCQERGYIQSFHTPSGTFEATTSQTPDVALWVVDASDEVNWLSSAQSLAALLADGKLRPTQRLLIVINKMDLVSWSQQVFQDLLRSFDVLNPETSRVFIPVSALHGTNIISSPEEHTWVSNVASSRLDTDGSLGLPLVNQLGFE